MPCGTICVDTWQLVATVSAVAGLLFFGSVSQIDSLQAALRRTGETIDKSMKKITETVEILRTSVTALEQKSKIMSKYVHQFANESAKAQLEKQIREILKNEMAKFFADKTNLPDFALESSGATVLSTGNTQLIHDNIRLLGLPVWRRKYSPNVMLQPSMSPGDCWAFGGHTGSAVIQLVTKIYVTSVSLEHIPKSISPSGNVTSAPKDFSIWGLNCLNEKEGFLFGNFTYDINRETLQTYSVQNECSKPYSLIKLEVLSNHGDNDYTCVYRLRVHGTIRRAPRKADSG